MATNTLTGRPPRSRLVVPFAALAVPMQRGSEPYLEHMQHVVVPEDVHTHLRAYATGIGVTDDFRRVIDRYGRPGHGTPPGFGIDYLLQADGAIHVDLRRDIGCAEDGRERPTGLLFSVDSINPHEIEPLAPLIAKLTSNPGIIYDQFLNDERLNPNREYKDRADVLRRIAEIVGPGVDISVELDDPFADFSRILEEAQELREILDPWRTVIKVPHTGPVAGHNAHELLEGYGRLTDPWWSPSPAQAFYGHNLALRLADAGFRVNFTLMFEPYQTELALQAKPAYINAFIRHRLLQTQVIARKLELFDADGEDSHLVELQEFMVDVDLLPSDGGGLDLQAVYRDAKALLEYRGHDLATGPDGLDSARHSLRALRGATDPEVRLIICSMEGPYMFPDIISMLNEPEIADMRDRVVITTDPAYLARFASSNQVVSYQRRFLRAAHTR